MFLEPSRLLTGLSLVRIGTHVQKALDTGAPVVALETAVVTHGLPPGTNWMAAQDMEVIVRSRGVTPATVGVVDGRLVIGLSERELETLAQRAQDRVRYEQAMEQALATGGEGPQGPPPVVKLGARDLGPFLARARMSRPGAEGFHLPRYGGTTVGATLVACRLTGIRVFATGGIGGVHRDPPYDVSGDLPQLAISPVIVVAAGVKSILHVEATFEYLETLGIPVIGYQTDTFPVFYAREYRPRGSARPLKVPYRADSPGEVAEMALAHWALGMQSGVLVVVPPPEDVALAWDELEAWMARAMEEARRLGKRGPEVTPFLLNRLQTLSEGRTVEVNVALLRNNAQVARDIARALYHAYPQYLASSSTQED